MPAGLFNFSRYFKKGTNTQGQNQTSDASNSDADQRLVVKEKTTTTTTMSQPVPYNGIGNPPGGVAYSSIGNPPKPPQSQQQEATDVDKKSDEKKDKDVSQAPGSSKSAIDMKKRIGMDVLSRLTQRANTALMNAVGKAKQLKLQYIDTEHVLWGLLSDSSIYQIISECKVTPAELVAELEKNFKPGNFAGQPQFSPRVKRVLELSLSAARSLGYEFVSPEHILLALSHEGEGLAARTLAKFNLKPEVLNQKITGKKELETEEKQKKTSVLDDYTEDLTAKALRNELDPVVGRTVEIERMIHIISRRTKNNPVLIGDAGVGKTAIVEGLAQRIAHGDVPETLLNKRVLSLDLMSLIAGAKHRGEFEERLKNLIKEVKSATGTIILFIDEIHNMVGAGSGSEGTMDASNILKPSLARGELHVIGTTTIAEYRKYIEKDAALERRFQPIYVAEPTAEVAIEMLTATRDKYEAFHRVKISDEAIEQAVKLSQRYIGDRFLPDKAVDLIDEAAASVRLPAISLPEEIKKEEDKLKKLEGERKEAEKIGDKVHADNLTRDIEELEQSLKDLNEQYQVKKSTTTNAVGPEIIAEIVSHWTNIPISRLTESESNKLMKMEDIIHKRLINQEDAVISVAEAVRRGRAGLKSNKRPIGSFIFMGPTGVGKTELAKTLAEILFGSEEMIVRLDMTEYMERHEVAKLIGAPPGYVGYEEGGQLTEAVRRRPYSVVLLDEIEKAHPDVFNILIQVLDDGRLTDNKGHTISFKNTIVICTSNLGSGLIQEEILGWSDASREEKIKEGESKVVKTYAVSPTGREILTFASRIWEKDGQEKVWKTRLLSDYFAGSTITSENKDFPIDGFDTHLIGPDGSETITFGDRMWFRTSTTVKEWVEKSILDQVKDNIVINAMPDKPEEQLPTAEIYTHAIAPTNAEITTYENRFWKRENLQTKDWVTGTLAEYFGEGVILGRSPPISLGVNSATTPESQDNAQNKVDSGQSQNDNEVSKSTIKEQKDKKSGGNLIQTDRKSNVKVDQVSDKQDKTEPNDIGKIQTARDVYPTSVNLKALNHLKGGRMVYPVRNSFQVKEPANLGKMGIEDKNKSQEDEKDEQKEEQKIEPAQFPTEKWDIHLFKPDGTEIIIAGNKYWQRKNIEELEWTSGNLKELFTTLDVDGGKIEEAIPLGVEEKKEEEKKKEDDRFIHLAEKLLEELRKFFRPELLNRFDEVVVFRPLTREHMVEIVNLQIKGLAKLLEEQDIAIEISHDARTYLAQVGYDPVYGARPLRRTMQRIVENPISSFLIKGDLAAGDTVVVDYDGEQLTFDIKKIQQRKQTVSENPQEQKTSEGKDSVKSYLCTSCNNQWQVKREESTPTVCPTCGSELIKLVEETAKEAKESTKIYQCANCHNQWEVKEGEVTPTTCPACSSELINRIEKAPKNTQEDKSLSSEQPQEEKKTSMDDSTSQDSLASYFTQTEETLPADSSPPPPPPSEENPPSDTKTVSV